MKKIKEIIPNVIFEGSRLTFIIIGYDLNDFSNGWLYYVMIRRILWHKTLKKSFALNEKENWFSD